MRALVPLRLRRGDADGISGDFSGSGAHCCVLLNDAEQKLSLKTRHRHPVAQRSLSLFFRFGSLVFRFGYRDRISSFVLRKEKLNTLVIQKPESVPPLVNPLLW